MKRRQLIVGIGAAVGSGGVVGTGAFTSVSAERDITVETADDADAFLAMEPLDTPNGNELATTDDGLIALDFSDTEVGGTGLGTDSVYEFDDLFRVTNQGTQPVYVWATFGGATGSFEVGTPDTDIWLYTDGNPENKLRDSADDVRYLAVGASADIGVYVDTDDLDEDQELTITITAAADKPSGGSGVVGGGSTLIEGPTDGLVNYWPLDSVESGVASDAAGAADGSISGSVTETSGLIGSAAGFDGDDGVITTDRNPGGANESFTTSGWLKAPSQSVPQNHFFISNYPDRRHNGFFAIGSNDGEEMLFWARDERKDNDKRFGRTTTAFDDVWHHYVGVRDATNDELRFYVDGDLEATAAFPGDVPVRDSDSSLGLMQHYSNRNLKGDVDDVRLYGRALSDAEVTELFNIGQE